MDKLIAKLPPHALPFVTRSLRGGRGRRYALLSLLAVAATVALGLWLALSPGRFAQGLRVDLDLEANEWERMHGEFVVFAHDTHELARFRRQLEDPTTAELELVHTSGYDPVSSVRTHGLLLARRVAWTNNPVGPELARLRERAQALVGPGQDVEWLVLDPREVATLERVLERAGVPQLELYRSPLGLREGLGLVGLLAGMVLAACVTVFGPLLVGIQQAQEQHENTLAPLTGTGFGARQLALGLASGPLAIIALFVAPQLLVFIVAVAIAGAPLLGLASLAALTATGLVMTFAAQLMGHLVGGKRSPGALAVALTGVFGLMWLIGAAMASDLDHDIAGAAAVLPTVGLTAVLADTFGFLAAAGHGALLAQPYVLLATIAWSLGALVFAYLILQVLARKIEGRQDAPLSAGAAAVAAVTAMVLVHLAIPELDWREAGLRMYLGLAMLGMPFALLLMARVAIGDEAPRLRRVPVARLLGELAAWVGVFAATAVLLFGLGAAVLHPFALLWLAWSVVVLGLLAIRAVALPSTLATHLLLGCCAISLAVAFVQATFWGLEAGRGARHLFALFEAGTAAGLVQIGITIAVPWVLLRSLRKGLGSVRG